MAQCPPPSVCPCVLLTWSLKVSKCELMPYLTVGSPECLTVRLRVRSQWAHCYHCMARSSVDPTNSSQQTLNVSCKLSEGSQQGHSVCSSGEVTVR